MKIPNIDFMVIELIIGVPGAIIATAQIINYLYKLLRPKTPRTKAPIQPAPPGYYRRRIAFIFLYILLALYCAFLALIYSGRQNIAATILFYTFTISTVFVIVLIPVSIYVTIKRL